MKGRPGVPQMISTGGRLGTLAVAVDGADNQKHRFIASEIFRICAVSNACRLCPAHRLARAADIRQTSY